MTSAESYIRIHTLERENKELLARIAELEAKVAELERVDWWEDDQGFIVESPDKELARLSGKSESQFLPYHALPTQTWERRQTASGWESVRVDGEGGK